MIFPTQGQLGCMETRKSSVCQVSEAQGGTFFPRITRPGPTFLYRVRDS